MGYALYSHIENTIKKINIISHEIFIIIFYIISHIIKFEIENVYEKNMKSISEIFEIFDHVT